MRPEPEPIDYGTIDGRATGSWFAQRRLGVSSLGCTAAALLVAITLVASPLSTRPDLMVLALAATVSIAVLLFSGGVTRIAGADHDRRRGLAIVGATVNFALLAALIYFMRR